jgi:hypothetical protein
MNDHTRNLLDVVFSGIQLLIILVSALWAYFRFRKEDPLYPRIEFGLKCKVFGPHQNSYLASFTITANNKGNVEHKFSEIRLRIRGIKINELLTEFKEYSPMVNFPEKIIEGINIVPAKFGYFFVRPGVNQAFNYATQIPGDIRFIIVRATFKYQSTNELHAAERVFEVREEANE